jgi:hypothetical protein
MLSLTSSYISEIPSWVKKLKKLKILLLAYNHELKNLDGLASHCKQLIFLDLRGTAVKKLPEEFWSIIRNMTIRIADDKFFMGITEMSDSDVIRELNEVGLSISSPDERANNNDNFLFPLNGKQEFCKLFRKFLSGK